MRHRLAFLALLLSMAANGATQGIINTIAGGGPYNVPATSANVSSVSGVWVDSAGNFYFTSSLHRVFKVDTSGKLNVVAGLAPGSVAFSGDGGPASAAMLFSPGGVVADGAGNVYFSDRGNKRVRRVNAATGIITTVAGNGASVFAGDGGPATAASLDSPRELALDSAGNLYIADPSNHRIRKVDAVTGIITTVAGSGVGGFNGGGDGGFSGDGGPATNALLLSPTGVAVDATGNMFIADSSNNRIRKVDAGTGIITTVAGNGTFVYSGDGGPALLAGMRTPTSVRVDNSGNLFIADLNSHHIRKVTPATGIISLVACSGFSGTFPGEGGLATSSPCNFPISVGVDAAGNIYIADANNSRIRKVSATTGIINTVAGGFAGTGAGDGGTATDAWLTSPSNIQLDSLGNYYIADRERVWKVDIATGIITTVAGTGLSGSTGDGGLATNARFFANDVTRDPAGNLFIADPNANRVRRVDAATGTITTIVGTGVAGFSGDGGPGTAAQLNIPFGLVTDSAGNLFISDSGNRRIRKWDAATGTITTIAGTGASGFNGDNITAISANLNSPAGIVLDNQGNLVFADRSQQRVRRISFATGLITTIAGNGSAGFFGDGGLATSAFLNQPTGVGIESTGNIYIADRSNQRIRQVNSTTGRIQTVAGNGSFAFTGDGGPATSAAVASPGGVAVDNIGRVYVVDTFNRRIRRIVFDSSAPVITPTVIGTLGINGWYTSDVAVSWTVNDPESGIASQTGCGSTTVMSDSTGVTLTCTATSVGGTASQSVTIKRDATPPTIQATTTPGSPAASGWYNIATGAPTISYSCQDDTSGLDGPCPSPVTPGNGANQSFTGNISDQAGNPASVTVSGLNVDLTAPVIAAHGNENAEATSASGATVTYSVPTASDATSGPGSVACLLASASVFGLGDTMVTCNASDVADNPAAATTFVVHVVDTTPPVITGMPADMIKEATSPSGAAASWISPTANDAVDGAVVVYCSPASGSTFALGAHTVTCTATDAHGNPATASFMVTVRDTIAPTINCGSADGVWHASNVSINCTATDGGSGPVSQNVALTTSVAAGIENPNASTNSAPLCDAVNNCSTAGPVGGNMIDRKAPSISIASPAAASYLLNQSAASSYGCSDGGSGSASCSGPVASGSNFDTASVGAKSFTVTATDNVGNSTNSAVNYSVIYASGGMCNGNAGHSILQPINVDGSSVFKQGSTVPAKFRVCDANGNSVGAAGVVASFNLVQTMSGTVVATVNEPVDSTTPDANFRWDSTAMQWIFNINTKTLSKNVTYFFRVTLNDGTTINFNFGLK